MYKNGTDNENWMNEALKEEPRYFLPDDFAQKMADKVAVKLAWHQYFKEFLVYLAVVAGVILVLLATEIFWMGAQWKTWWQFVASNASLIIGVNILLVFVLFADRVLLRYFMGLKNMEIN